MVFTIIGLAVCGILFGAFFLFLLGSFIMRSRKLFYRALIVLPVLLLSIFITGRKILSALPGQRTGIQVYDAVFGKPKNQDISTPHPRQRAATQLYEGTFGKPRENCVEIISFFDPVLPIIDDCAYIEFKACPGELTRILHGRKFTFRKEPATNFQPVCAGKNSIAFELATKGDSILIFSDFDSSATRGAIISASTDSTFIFYEDILY